MAVAVALCGLVLLPSAACAQEFWADTYLLDLYAGSSRSDAARSLRWGGYELADGTPVDFEAWYTPQRSDVSVLLLTQVASDFGVIWGVSLGEDAPKYRIDPALHLGFIYQVPLFDGATLSIKATQVIGGDLQEGTCVADYGEIGGVQQVNCRLAAEPIPPEETLDYLLSVDGSTDSRISVIFEYRF